MNLPIQGRGRPVARLQNHDLTHATLRVECDQDPAVWYELPLTRATLHAIVAELDAAWAVPEPVDPPPDVNPGQEEGDGP